MLMHNVVRVMALFAVVVACSLSAQAGAIGGPKETVTRVNAQDTDRFQPITFRGGELAMVGLKGDGDTDLDLYIYDENGNLVAKDDDYTDGCFASWVPRSTARYYIVVRNRGRIYNQYLMMTN